MSVKRATFVLTILLLLVACGGSDPRTHADAHCGANFDGYRRSHSNGHT